MRRFSTDRAGASEVVGALILILVVTIAATSFGAFIQVKQKQIQTQQQFSLSRDLENLEIQRVKPTAGAGEWTILSFSVVALHNSPSSITSFELNGETASDVLLSRYDRSLDTWVATATDFLEPIVLEPRERVFMEFTLATDFYVAPTILFTDAIAADVSTLFMNHFTRDFLPPTAVALIHIDSIWDGAAYDNFVRLDATLSDHPDERSSIQKWEWTVYNTVTTTTTNHNGRLVRAYECTDADPRDITLTLTDTNGLQASEVIEDYVC